MTTEPTRCVVCDEPIAVVGHYWMHFVPSKDRHAATPAQSTPARTTTELLQGEINRLLRDNAALRAALALDNQEEPEPDPLRPAVVRYLAAHADYLQAVDLGGDGAVQGDALWRARVALRRVVEGGDPGSSPLDDPRVQRALRWVISQWGDDPLSDAGALRQLLRGGRAS